MMHLCRPAMISRHIECYLGGVLKVSRDVQYVWTNKRLSDWRRELNFHSLIVIGVSCLAIMHLEIELHLEKAELLWGLLLNAYLGINFMLRWNTIQW